MFLKNTDVRNAYCIKLNENKKGLQILKYHMILIFKKKHMVEKPSKRYIKMNYELLYYGQFKIFFLYSLGTS